MRSRLLPAFGLIALVALTLVLASTLAPPPAATTDPAVTFRSPGGNEWWIQVYADTSQTLQGVDARVNGGAWQPLALKSWGAWAASHHAPEGSVVQFRATGSNGAVALSGCYRWTSATTTSCPGSVAPTHVRFTHGGGNEWWVEVTVHPFPQAVQAMDTGDVWRTLTFRDWGEWAGSFHIEPGNQVRFRAQIDGAWVESCWFSHPGGVAQSCTQGTSPPPPSSGKRKLVVMGDTGTNANTRTNVQGAINDGVQGMIGTGDYYYEDAPSSWKAIFKPILDRGSYLTLGNHDEGPALADVMPHGATWSVNINGARVVGIDSNRNMAKGSEQYNFARNALCSAPEQLRVLAMHHNWWLLSGARHPGTEFQAAPSDMDALVAECGVDLVFAAHEHNYQRMMRGQVAYVVVGTGGQSLYPLNGVPPGTVAKHATFGRVIIELDASGYVATFRGLNGAELDAFGGRADSTYQAPPAPSQPSTSVTHRGGNEWWVEVVVTPTPTAVEAMDTNGGWVALTARSWGTWAGSFHIEPGHEVRFRAMIDGGWVESCWYSHPAGVARCSGGTPSFAATFTNPSGNEWWEQIHVSGTQTIVGVDVRINGGAWQPLTFRDWGAWAASYHAPSGSNVVFRAVSDTGAVAQSQAYAWPPT